MQTPSDNETTVTLQLTLAELASINDALAVRCSVSLVPRHPGFRNDKLDEADYDRANDLEKRTFGLYATYSQQARLPEQDEVVNPDTIAEYEDSRYNWPID